MSAEFPLLFGQIVGGLKPAILAEKLNGNGLTVKGGEFGPIQVEVRGVRIAIEATEEGVFSITANGSAETLEAAANRLSLAITALSLQHRIEVFDEGGSAIAFFHLDWPYPGEFYEYGKARVDLSFEEWVQFVFDREIIGPEWYCNSSEDWWEAPATVQAEYIARLFETSRESLTGYSDAQVNQGLWYIGSNGLSDYMFSLIDDSVEWSLGQRAIRSMFDLFAQCFAPRCSPGLSHRSEPGLNPLNGVCYMWFDLIPIHGHPADLSRRAMDGEMLDVLERILGLDSEACQEGALHGLGHWQIFYPQRARKAIDSFLSRARGIRRDLRSYAVNARTGCVQ